MLTFVLMLTTTSINAQKIALTGFVIDGKNLEDLSAVHVYLEEHIGTTSDLNGKFYFQANYLDTLHFTRIGYDSLSIIISDTIRSQSLFIAMKSSSNVLKNVDINAIYQSNTIIQKPAQPLIKLSGYDYSDRTEENYHLGLAAITSPITALYRIFSKSYKEEKKNYEILKVRKVKDALFAQASKNLSAILAMSDVYLDDYFYRDFIHHSGLTTRYVAESTEYELLVILPQAIKQYSRHLESQE
jgi:hypothetical protein